MKKVLLLLACSFIALSAIGSEKENVDTEIKAYYFHNARRCVTCKAVEDVAYNALKELSGGKIMLQSVNLDDKTNKDLIKQIGAKGQALLILKGDKKIDLTTEGFLNARSNPEKFIQKIKETLDSLQ
ncbi:MAG: nitrophenyl compound nitroreductase subunit ArsF family protein [Bacteroidales bacterium]|jgi:hypothetical protein